MLLTMIEPYLLPGEHGVLVGITGSGKSVLSQAIIRRSNAPRVVIVDPKRMYTLPWRRDEQKVITSANGISKRDGIYIFRPNREDLLNPTIYDRVYERCLDLGGTFVYTDDVAGVEVRGEYPDTLQQALMIGRGLKVSCLNSVQRVHNVPLAVISESRKQYVFSIQMDRDKQRLREIIPNLDYYARSIKPKEYQFIYHRTGDMTSEIASVKLV